MGLASSSPSTKPGQLQLKSLFILFIGVFVDFVIVLFGIVFACGFFHQILLVGMVLRDPIWVEW